MLATITNRFRQQPQPAVEQPSRDELLARLDAVEAERQTALEPLNVRQQTADQRVEILQRQLKLAETDAGRVRLEILDVNHQFNRQRDAAQAALAELLPEAVRNAITALERRKADLNHEIKTGDRWMKSQARGSEGMPFCEEVVTNGAAIRQRAEAIDAALLELREMTFTRFDDLEFEVTAIVGNLLEPV